MVWRLILRFLRKLNNALVWHLMPWLSFRINRHVSPIQAVVSWPDGNVALGPRVAVFVHFDAAGEVRPYVRDYVRALQASGLSVLFVSNAGRLRPEAMEAIKPYCAGILVRQNIGYDFAAMREGLAHFGLPRAETEMVVIANDSVYGPLVPLDAVLARMNFAQADFWGLTDSWQARYHLQSFFLVAGPKLLRHPAWASFWGQVHSVPNKRWVINRYEVGITQWMLKAGVSCAAVWRYDDLVRDVDLGLLDVADEGRADPVQTVRRQQARRIRTCYVNNIALNPTSDMWRQLLVAGFPFVKRELLRDNPTTVHDVMDWRAVVAETSDADLRMIDRDLQRQLRNRTA